MKEPNLKEVGGTIGGLCKEMIKGDSCRILEMQELTGPNPIAPLGRRLESWPDTLAAGQAVRVMVWLGLESWCTRLNCSLEVITRGVSLGQ